MRLGTLDRTWLTDPRVERYGHGYWPRMSSGGIALTARFRSLMKSRLGRAPARRVTGSIAVAIPLRTFPD